MATTYEDALLAELSGIEQRPNPDKVRVRDIKAELARIKGDVVETTVAPDVAAPEPKAAPAKVERAVRKKAR